MDISELNLTDFDANHQKVKIVKDFNSIVQAAKDGVYCNIEGRVKIPKIKAVMNIMLHEMFFNKVPGI